MNGKIANLGHVEIDIRFRNQKPYEVKDDAANFVFSTDLFKECFIDFENCEGDNVRKIEVNHLKERYKLFKHKIPNTDKDYKTACFKIKKLIKYIEKNYDNYIGIQLYY